jgi:hypothetical protein
LTAPNVPFFTNAAILRILVLEVLWLPIWVATLWSRAIFAICRASQMVRVKGFSQ